MIVFGEANFMLPRAIFGFHSWDNVVFPDLLKRSCCATVRGSDPQPLPLKRVERSSFERAQSKDFRFTAPEAPGVTQTGAELLQTRWSTSDGKAWTRVWVRCLSVFLRFCRISGQLNCGAENGYFRGNVALFQDEKCWFSWSMLLHLIIITPFSQSQEYKNVIYRYLIH